MGGGTKPTFVNFSTIYFILLNTCSTSTGTSLEGTPIFAHVTLHHTFNPLGSVPGGKMRKQLLKDHTFLTIHRFSPLKVLLLIYLLFKKHYIQYISIWKIVLIWWKVLDTIVLWQDVGPCCEQTHAAFEVGLSLDQGQGVYSGWSDVDASSQLRLCTTCIIGVMLRRHRTHYDVTVMNNVIKTPPNAYLIGCMVYKGPSLEKQLPPTWLATPLCVFNVTFGIITTIRVPHDRPMDRTEWILLLCYRWTLASHMIWDPLQYWLEHILRGHKG